jgi:hypothetical protein
MVVFSDNAGSGSQSVNLYGTGQPYLTSIAVTPVNPSISVGGAQQFVATGAYNDGSTGDVTSSVYWSSSNTSVASVNATGLATANGTGSSTINAMYNGVNGSTVLTAH